MKRLVILDYGSGNLRSAERAFARTGAQVQVTSDPKSALDADGLVIPGVGAFAACMAGLNAVGAGALVAERIHMGRPTLGICVGMQVLFTLGVEHGIETRGLAQWPDSVERLDAPRLPHMGWNTVQSPADSLLFSGIGDQRFYFVHSYAARTWNGSSSARLTWSEHGQPFLAAVEDGVLAATQFHPEKSGDAGAALIANWVSGL